MRMDFAACAVFGAVLGGIAATTTTSQHFYAPEFARALRREPALGDAMPAGTPSRHALGAFTTAVEMSAAANAVAEIDAFLSALQGPADAGWRFRLGRDMLSLVGNAAILTMIGQRFLRDAAGECVDVGTANTPFGTPWADWLLLSLEGVKGGITQMLGYPTLIRHHAVDEYIKRLDAGTRLLEAAMRPQGDVRAGGSGRAWLAACERLREVATGFTLANTCVPPARLVLWISQWTDAGGAAGHESHHSAAFEFHRGWLRLAGLSLDSLRAITSLAGTAARTALFKCDAQAVRRRLMELVRMAGDDNANVPASVPLRLAQVAALVECCDTALLSAIDRHEVLREALFGAAKLSAEDIMAQCKAHGVQCAPKRTDGRLRLCCQAAESAWGKRWRNGAWRWAGATGVRIAYRLLLSYQHFSSALPEWVAHRFHERSRAAVREAAGVRSPRSGPVTPATSAAYLLRADTATKL
ncbi:hypothetical protein [Pandoraea terrae]|nr:hypothetical protein [Pandoraea terrae]